MKKLRFVIVLAALAVVASAQADNQLPAESHDGLKLVDKTKADTVYALPEADFADYKSFIILEPSVAFRKNWARDVNRNTGQRVRDKDMERIRIGMAELFMETFTRELEDAGYPVVEEAGDDVLVLRPAIVNLDVAAPDLNSPGRTRTYAASAGSASLYLEVFDSLTGQILARAIDYKRARDSMDFRWATSTTNRQEARRVLRSWANMLVKRLDQIHKG